MTDDIVTFIRARLDEDRAAANEMQENANWMSDCGEAHNASINLRSGWEMDSARVLRGVEAKRRLVDDLLAQQHFSNDRDWYGCQSLKEGPGDGPDVPTGRPCTCGRDEDVERRLRLIALEWSTNEDYRSDWTP